MSYSEISGRLARDLCRLRPVVDDSHPPIMSLEPFARSHRHAQVTHVGRVSQSEQRVDLLLHARYDTPEFGDLFFGSHAIRGAPVNTPMR
jgi:hypothetical protein